MFENIAGLTVQLAADRLQGRKANGPGATGLEHREVLNRNADRFGKLGQLHLPLGQDSEVVRPEVILKVYPEAHHGFNIEGLDENQNGHLVRYDEAVAKYAIERARAFLAMRLGGGGE